MSLQKEIFVLIGPPGAGKGSLSQMLCSRIKGCRQLSTGNLCRRHIAEKTEIGQAIDFAIKSGKLVSDDLIVCMVESWFLQETDTGSAVIFDGYPRTVVQAQALIELANNKSDGVRLRVVRFDLSDDVIVNRLSKRFICGNKECQAVYSMLPGSALAPKKANTCDACSGALIRRKDDEESAIRERLAVYHRHEQELINFYTYVGQDITHINVDQSIDHVFEDFCEKLGLSTND